VSDWTKAGVGRGEEKGRREMKGRGELGNGRVKKNASKGRKDKNKVSLT